MPVSQTTSHAGTFDLSDLVGVTLERRGESEETKPHEFRTVYKPWAVGTFTVAGGEPVKVEVKIDDAKLAGALAGIGAMLLAAANAKVQP